LDRVTVVKFGFVIPGGDIRTILSLASEAESAGWDGIFYWDAIYIKQVGPMHDAWSVLAALALRTSKIRIGAMLTAVNRRRPWKLARESVTVDHLSNGRLIIPVGLGAMDDGGYTKVGEPQDRKQRAELLDEGLDILEGLWTGKPFQYKGKHYQIGEMTFLPRPVQRPRIPIWVVGAWPSARSMGRALKYDGVIPTTKGPDGLFGKVSPEDLPAIRKFIQRHRKARRSFEIVCEGETPVGDHEKGEEIIKRWEDAGATWWIESRWSKPSESLARIKQGPPRT
jgi:alkanesulfonate monooxygenase SsuD/methylene tetrahydromethanopterin reductase-like flavin-dependent oxidoreductase (luciferase family)